MKYVSHIKGVRAILNLCMAYTARDEMTTAVQTCIEHTQGTSHVKPYAIAARIPHGLKLISRTITVEDIDSQMMTSLVGSPPLDVLIRSSGVNRLSDFLLWQVCTHFDINSDALTRFVLPVL